MFSCSPLCGDEPVLSVRNSEMFDLSPFYGVFSSLQN